MLRHADWQGTRGKARCRCNISPRGTSSLLVASRAVRHTCCCARARALMAPSSKMLTAVLSLKSGACSCPTQLCMTWRAHARRQQTRHSRGRPTRLARWPPAKRVRASTAPPDAYVDHLCKDIVAAPSEAGLLERRRHASCGVVPEAALAAQRYQVI